MSSVLIVSNQRAELRHVVTSLAHGGYDAQGPMEPLDARHRCSTHPPGALLVDVGLRDLSAAEFCGVVRGRIASARVPILLVGGNATAPMAPAAAGADAYVSAPDVLERLVGGAVNERTQGSVSCDREPHGVCRSLPVGSLLAERCVRSFRRRS